MLRKTMGSTILFCLKRTRILLRVAEEILTQPGVPGQTVPCPGAIPVRHEMSSFPGNHGLVSLQKDTALWKGDGMTWTALFRLFPVRVILVVFPLAIMGCASTPRTTGSPESLNRLYLKDMNAGNLPKARRDLDRLVRINPHDAIAWNNLAYIDFRETHIQLAESDLSQGIKVSPGSISLQMNAIRLELAVAQYQKARKTLLKIACNQKPWPRGFHLLLAIADIHTGHPEEAEILLRETLSKRPGDRLALLNLEKLKKAFPGTVSSGREHP